MYLSKIDLNINHAGVRKDLGDCHRLHQKVMMGFPDRRELSEPKPFGNQKTECRKDWQILYRLEGASLLVQSSIKPNWDQLPAGYQPDGEIRELDFQTIQAGQRLKFRLVANPVRQHTYELKDADGNTIFKKDEDGKTILKPDGSGKPQQKAHRYLIFKEEEQIQWLAKHLKGSELEECYVGSPGKIHRGAKSSIIRTVQFDGLLQVVNPSEFLDVLKQGIGRGKSYGCGLLSLARLG